jgi:hypothetical protein
MTMQAIKVPTRLTNSVDQGMFRRGLIPESQVRWIEADAVVDSQAIRSTVPQHVMTQLGLMWASATTVLMADGSEQKRQVTEPVTLGLLHRFTTELCIVEGNEVRLGRTALASTDLIVDKASQRVITNPAHPNGWTVSV